MGRCRLTNPETGEYFQLTDFAVGKVVHIAGQPFHIYRADEHALVYMETHCDEVPFADPRVCARKLMPLRNLPELRDPKGLDPDQLKDYAAQHGVEMIDHEIITLLRSCAV